jgi:predicted metal-dependent peptidase
MYHNKDVDRKLWDLSCDIALEHAISQLKLMAVTVEREQKQRDITEKLKRQAGMLTAGKIYRWLLTHPLGETEYETWRRLFFADGHDLWYENGETIQTQRTGLEDWQEIARRMQVDMETFARRQGDKAEAIMQNLREVNRETYDYAGFLRKFATRGEPMRTNPDEFDYIFYTYGMRLYENMPLIEPLEYRDIKNIREFVVALQFSGLLSLKEVRGFIRKTYEVLRATDSPKSQVRLHFLLCDGANAEYVHIRDETELETLLQRLKIRDETDFRPAFIHADGMLQRGEFRNLRGLIYLTDGAGAFPRAKPNYYAVFVFVNDDYGKPDVPPWAIRIVLQRDEIDYDKQQ